MTPTTVMMRPSDTAAITMMTFLRIMSVAPPVALAMDAATLVECNAELEEEKELLLERSPDFKAVFVLSPDEVSPGARTSPPELPGSPALRGDMASQKIDPLVQLSRAGPR